MPLERACSRRLLADWYGNGVADRHYRHGCYAAALGAVPVSGPDTLTVSDDLRRDHRRDARSSVVDEGEATFRLLGIGSSLAEVATVLGKGATEGGFAPAGTLPAEAAVPQALPNPPGVRGRPQLRRYPDRAFLAARGRVYAMLITTPDARTTRGVRIGDAMTKAKRLYGGAHCYRPPAGERAGTADAYLVCRVTIAPGRYMSFGGDPIRSFTLYTREAGPAQPRVRG